MTTFSRYTIMTTHYTVLIVWWVFQMKVFICMHYLSPGTVQPPDCETDD